MQLIFYLTYFDLDINFFNFNISYHHATDNVIINLESFELGPTILAVVKIPY